LFLLRSERLAKGTAIPAERELAKMLEVSRVTVRAALVNLVMQGVLTRRGRGGTVVVKVPSDETATAKQKKLRFVYFPSQVQRSLRDVGAFSKVWQGFERFVHARGDSALSQSGENFTALAEGDRSEYDGLVVAGAVSDPARMELLRRAGCPVVVLNWPRGLRGFDTVSCDFFEAGERAVERCLPERGDEILFIGARFHGEAAVQPIFTEGLRGMEAAAARSGARVRVVWVEIGDGDWLPGALAAVGAERARGEPTALLALGGQMHPLLVALRGSRKALRSVLIETGWIEEGAPGIERVDLDLAACGLAGARRLYEILAEPQAPQRILLPVE